MKSSFRNYSELEHANIKPIPLISLDMTDNLDLIKVLNILTCPMQIAFLKLKSYQKDPIKLNNFSCKMFLSKWICLVLAGRETSFFDLADLTELNKNG